MGHLEEGSSTRGGCRYVTGIGNIVFFSRFFRLVRFFVGHWLVWVTLLISCTSSLMLARKQRARTVIIADKCNPDS